jgi:hypothetical protein
LSHHHTSFCTGLSQSQEAVGNLLTSQQDLLDEFFDSASKRTFSDAFSFAPTSTPDHEEENIKPQLKRRKSTPIKKNTSSSEKVKRKKERKRDRDREIEIESGEREKEKERKRERDRGERERERKRERGDVELSFY